MSQPDVFGTATIAKMCRCSPRLVAQWIDSGRLGGYRLPGTRTRRVTRTALLRFMREYKMPAEWYAVLKAHSTPSDSLQDAA